MTNKEMIIDAFMHVKNMRWVTSRRPNNTGIGKTFEDYVGVIENNLDEPDLFGFEIKAHRQASSSYITLFTKSPSSPRGANAYLKDNFGEYYPGTTNKKLHTSMFANSYNTYINQYSFKLIHQPEEKRIYIGIYSLDRNTLLDRRVYYTYADIERCLTKKLKNLFFVSAQRRFSSQNEEEFYFDSATIYTNPSLANFLKMLDAGEIMYDIRIGSYQSGSKTGKPHDHGSGFRIKEDNIIKLYDTAEYVQ